MWDLTLITIFINYQLYVNYSSSKYKKYGTEVLHFSYFEVWWLWGFKSQQEVANSDLESVQFYILFVFLSSKVVHTTYYNVEVELKVVNFSLRKNKLDPLAYSS
jgi:hypothetical protein